MKTKKLPDGREVPVIGEGHPWQTPKQPNPATNPVVASCGVCGRDIPQIDHYCCRRSDCPIQRHVTL